jgi:hypothetical protein
MGSACPQVSPARLSKCEFGFARKGLHAEMDLQLAARC